MLYIWLLEKTYFCSRISHANQQQALPDLICSSWEDQFSPVLEGWKKVQREHLLLGLKLRTCQRGTQPGMTCSTNRSWSKRKRTFFKLRGRSWVTLLLSNEGHFSKCWCSKSVSSSHYVPVADNEEIGLK